MGKPKNGGDDGAKKRLAGKTGGIPTNLTTKSRRFESRRHPQLELSPVFVRNVSEPGYYCDGNGLYLQVAPGGSKSAAKFVHAEHSKTFRKPKHAAQWITTLETYVFPHIGNKRVDSIESGDVLKVLSPIWLEKPETAARIKQRMKTVFDWAIAAGHRTAANPCAAITKVLPKHNGEEQHFAALHYDEVPAFIQELRNDVGISGRLAFEFLPRQKKSWVDSGSGNLASE